MYNICFIDLDGSGKINIRELELVVRKMGQQPSNGQLQAMMEMADKGGDGEIDWEEFVELVAVLKTQAANFEGDLKRNEEVAAKARAELLNKIKAQLQEQLGDKLCNHFVQSASRLKAATR